MSTKKEDQQTQCPTCGTETTFHYVGDQVYPEKIAKAAGYTSNHFSLWMCDHCSTTMLQPKHVLHTIESK